MITSCSPLHLGSIQGQQTDRPSQKKASWFLKSLCLFSEMLNGARGQGGGTRGDLEAWPWLLCSSAAGSGRSEPCPDEVWLLKGTEVQLHSVALCEMVRVTAWVPASPGQAHAAESSCFANITVTLRSGGAPALFPAYISTCTWGVLFAGGDET